ncbi:ferrous iron transport protein B [Selenomonadales bacterium OttesenSCG-928-I06]|nr:ferrous iron transport protein B [Selenomonadales bacterium OttesenSCG-928-I06]
MSEEKLNKGVQKDKYFVALAGNPNSGKTTIFNNLTGSRQHVGNYPGVTIEKREGTKKHQGSKFNIVDLPGTYSLTAYSEEEKIARSVIVREKPDIVVDVLDASNLERNLYLAVQILELNKPTIFALNMMDVADDRGIKISDEKLYEIFGVPIVRTIGSRRQGMNDILDSAKSLTDYSKEQNFKIDYGSEIENYISELSDALNKTGADLEFPTRWFSLKLLENDQEIMGIVNKIESGTQIIKKSATMRAEYEQNHDEDLELTIANLRYQFISNALKEAVQFSSSDKPTTSDKIDKILTNRLYAIPIFLGLMWVLFTLVFTLGEYPMGWIEEGFGVLSEVVEGSMAEGPLRSLIVDGIIAGVGGVLVFLPNILILFLGIAFLEDSGYMARVAFIMDRVMRSVGLHGKSFIPLLIGFGCGVPAIMGARTLENPRDRLVTILVTPLMSCGARLPVYTLLIGAFFSDHIAGTVLFSIYLVGIILALLMARIFRTVLFPGAVDPFVMELPPYHLPTLRNVAIHMLERAWLYVKKAGTIILATSILIWFLTSYPSEENLNYSKNYDELMGQIQVTLEQVQGEDAGEGENPAVVVDEEQVVAVELDEEEIAALEEELITLENDKNKETLEQSYAGRIGKAIEPIIKPLGFDWKIGVGLFAGLAAKEVVVSTLATIYSVGEDDEESDFSGLRDRLAKDPTMNPVVAYSLMLFVLIYVPCFAALAVIYRETRSVKWTAFTMVYTTALAWLVSFGFYQIATRLFM